MKSFEISISSIEEMKQFYEYVLSVDCELDLKRGRYCVDAKNMLGIASLGIKDTFELIIWLDEEIADKLMRKMLEKLEFL